MNSQVVEWNFKIPDAPQNEIIVKEEEEKVEEP